EELESLDLEEEVAAVFAEPARGDGSLPEVGAGVGKMRLDALAREAAGDRGHRLLGNGVAGEFALVPGDEGGVLEFVRPGAEQSMAVDMGAEEDAPGISAPRHEDAEVTLHGDADPL